MRRVLKNESPQFKPTNLLASDQYRFSTHHQKLARMYFEFNSEKARLLQRVAIFSEEKKDSLYKVVSKRRKKPDLAIE